MLVLIHGDREYVERVSQRKSLEQLTFANLKLSSYWFLSVSLILLALEVL